jgi:hypothetical protein
MQENLMINVAHNFTISNPGLKAFLSNASAGYTVRFLGVMIGVF